MVQQAGRAVAGLVLVLFLGGPGELWGQPSGVPKKVLILHADNQFQPANLVMDREFLTRFTGVPGVPVTLFSEYLQAVTFSSARVSELRTALLKEKYAGSGLDLVIATDDTSFDFLEAHRSKLFPDVPVIFCGITIGKVDAGRLPPETTGNFKRVDILANLRNIHKIQPMVTDVEVVLGTSPQDRYYGQVTAKAFEDFGPGLKATYLTGRTIEEIGQIVGGLPKTTAVLYVSLYRDGAGRGEHSIPATPSTSWPPGPASRSTVYQTPIWVTGSSGATF